MEEDDGLGLRTEFDVVVGHAKGDLRKVESYVWI